jgi:hypothetical protein
MQQSSMKTGMFELEEEETVSRKSVAPAHTSKLEVKSRLRVKVLGIIGSAAVSGGEDAPRWCC